MSNPPVSRRGFFKQAARTTVVGAAQTAAALPARAWVIVGTNWEFNDDWHYEAGESVVPQVYFDEQQAKDDCRKLNEAFFAEQGPQEFQVDWNVYEVDDPDEATWDEVKAAGFRDPYWVQELTT
jgi:hypothetical protein